MSCDNLENDILNKEEIHGAKYDEIKTDFCEQISNKGEGESGNRRKGTRLFFNGLMIMKPKGIRVKSQTFVRGIKKVYTICLTSVL